MGMTHLGTFFDAEKCNHILARGRHGLLSGKWFQNELNCWISPPSICSLDKKFKHFSRTLDNLPVRPMQSFAPPNG